MWVINIIEEGELKSMNFWRAVAAEFFGTTLFLLCVTTVAINWTNSPGPGNNVEVGIGIGLSIATLAQAFGHVSGGHLNPAVTFGLAIGGRCSLVKGSFYIIAQTVGGIAGSAITYGCTPSRIVEVNKLGVNGLLNGVKVGHGFALEMLFTFILVFFVFSVTDPKKNVEPYGTTLGIGIAIWVSHVCLIPYTNCGINPARSFGPAVVMNLWDDHWIFWIGPLIGGLLAALLYNFVFYVEEREDENIKPNRESTYQLKSQSSTT